MNRWWLVLVCLTGCHGGPDQERNGDIAWRNGRWPEAMAAYRSVGGVPRVMAKYADAAFRGGFLPEAVAGWRDLGVLSPENAAEAAAGLARVAMTAERERNQVVLASAIVALRTIAPDWPAGRLVRHLDGDRGLTPQDAAVLWPVIAAAAPDSATVTHALIGLGMADTERGACESAVAVYESAARITEGAQRDSVFTGMARCELVFGLTAMEQSHDGDAENWFSRAVGHDPVGGSGRRALVGLGDARLRQGDLASALIAWRAVVTAPGTPDSTFNLALERLQTAQSASPDSSVIARDGFDAR